ncbi:hypothetical protein SDJN02_08874, partial [Cucurbita argyrosperma subsp. argyrosperma]
MLFFFAVSFKTILLPAISTSRHSEFCPGVLFNCGERLEMDENGGIKLTGIRQIVRLKETLQHWQGVTINPVSKAAAHENQSQNLNQNNGILSPAINKRLTNGRCELPFASLYLNVKHMIV